MAYVEVDLDRIDTDDLLDELENRYLNDSEKIQLATLLKNDPCEKYKLFLSVMDRYSLMELQDLFCEKFPHIQPPKEQLALPLNYQP